MDWKLFAWVKRGKTRKKVIKLLAKSKSPWSINDIKKELDMAIPQASRTIKELNEKNLVECLNPKDNIGKLYRLSNKGEEIINEL